MEEEKRAQFILTCPDCSGQAFNVYAQGYGMGTVRCINCKLELVIEECPTIKEEV